MPQNSPGGPSVVSEESGQLSFSGPGRVYRTNQCWEQYPGLRRVAHSKSAHAWSNTCKSAANDPRQASIQTSVSVHGDSTIKFRETGAYEFNIEKSKCVAQVTRSRTFTRAAAQEVNKEPAPSEVSAGEVSAETGQVRGPSPTGGSGNTPALGKAPARVAISSASPTSGTKEPSGAVGGEEPTVEHQVRRDCASVGPAHEIRTPSAVHWLQPGSTYRLAPVVVDAGGCFVAKGPFTYLVEPATRAISVGSKSGVIHVAPDAAEGKYSVVIRSAALRAVIEVPVITREGLAALLQGPAQEMLIEESPTAPNSVPELLGATPAETVDQGTPRKWWFVGLAGLVTLGLGLLGLRLLRAGSRPTLPPPEPRAISSNADVATAPSANASFKMDWSTRESSRSDPPPKPSSRPAPNVGGRGPSLEVARKCPQCGMHYTDGSVFCGTDGTKLL